MSKYRIEVPFTAFLIVEIEADEEEEALDQVEERWICMSAMGSIMTTRGVVYKPADSMLWDKMTVEEIK